MNSTRSHQPNIDSACLVAPSAARTWNSTDLVGFLMEDQRRSWATGQRRRAEDYIQLHPQVAKDGEGLQDLIYNEVCLRSEAGESPSRAEYVQRFPQFAAEIECLFDVHAVIESDESWPSGGPGADEDWSNRRIAHYEIESRLGAGGMGQVFLARDLTLDRKVALKVLPDHFSAALQARLLREAETSARLQHPCIATFYEASRPDGQTFIAMEYVAGEVLRDAIRGGPIPVDRTISLLSCVLEALGHAHTWAILHRDIKPENIMVTGEDEAKLLDFGIAQRLCVVDPDADRHIDKKGIGSLVGTPGYMSPEQIKAKQLDGRSDLFGVGAILFEMLTGSPAFPGDTIFERIEATLHDDLSDKLKEVPEGLREIVARALARDRSERYAMAADFLTELRALEAHRCTKRSRTIAVLPMEVDEAVPTWVGSGVTDGLGRDLKRQLRLNVVPEARVASVLASSSNPAPPSVGNALACDLVVSGKVRPIGGALQFHVQLTDVPVNRVIAIDEFKTSTKHVQDAQRQITSFLCAQLHEPKVSEHCETARAAYEYYARGRQLWLSGDKADLQKASLMFHRCVEIEPTHAPALAGLATAHAMRYIFTTDKNDLTKAEAFARRALLSDPMDGNAHVWLGYTLGHQGRYLECYQQQVEAIRCDPSNYMAFYFGVFPFVVSHSCSSASELRRHFSSLAGDPHPWRRREALKWVRRALELNPLHGWSWLSLGNLLMDLGELTSAASAFQKAIRLESITKQNATAGAEGYLGECQRRAGNISRSQVHCMNGLKALEESDNVYRDTFRGVFLCCLGRGFLAMGDREAAKTVFLQAVQHLQGRSRARAGGHPMVQALAGLAAAERSAERLGESIELFGGRHGFDFSFMWCCTDDLTLLDLSRSAQHLGKNDLADSLWSRAKDAGAGDW